MIKPNYISHLEGAADLVARDSESRNYLSRLEGAADLVARDYESRNESRNESRWSVDIKYVDIGPIYLESNNPLIWKNYFNKLRKLSTSLVTLSFSYNGLSIIYNEDKSFTLIGFIPRSNFSSYSVKKGQKTAINILLIDFLDAMNMITKNDKSLSLLITSYQEKIIIEIIGKCVKRKEIYIPIINDILKKKIIFRDPQLLVLEVKEFNTMINNMKKDINGDIIIEISKELKKIIFKNNSYQYLFSVDNSYEIQGTLKDSKISINKCNIKLLTNCNSGSIKIFVDAEKIGFETRFEDTDPVIRYVLFDTRFTISGNDVGYKIGGRPL